MKICMICWPTILVTSGIKCIDRTILLGFFFPTIIGEQLGRGGRFIFVGRLQVPGSRILMRVSGI